MGLSARVPWWGKTAAKILLSRLPAGYSIWQRLGLFRHGYMDNAQYAIDIFAAHVERAGFVGRLQGKTIMELGPGDSAATALICHAYGARAILSDVGPFASRELELYRKLAELLNVSGFVTPNLNQVYTLEEFLESCQASYLTEGLEGLRSLPCNSVDFVFSQAVLEHIRKEEFLETQKEIARILKPQGVCSHRVDLRDHLGGGLNNLRFNKKIWESDFFAESGFYTNRLRFSNMIRYFCDAGFEVELSETRKWDIIPIKRRQLAGEFQDMPDEELSISGFDVLLRNNKGI